MPYFDIYNTKNYEKAGMLSLLLITETNVCVKNSVFCAVSQFFFFLQFPSLPGIPYFSLPESPKFLIF